MEDIDFSATVLLRSVRKISSFLFSHRLTAAPAIHYGMISTGDHGNFYPLREHSPGGSGGRCRASAFQIPILRTRETYIFFDLF